MSGIAQFKIDLKKEFQALPKAPIVEAALGIQARALGTWDQETVAGRIKDALPEYAHLQSHNRVIQATRFDGQQIPHATMQNLGWMGFRIMSDSKPHVAQFNRDGFVFSRLQPYINWETFIHEALRLWSVYSEMATPTQVERLHLRYVNRIDLPLGNMKFEEYIDPAPRPPRDMSLPFYGFLHQDVLGVPGTDYSINITRTVQTPQEPSSQGLGLILDISVMTMQPFEQTLDAMNRRLPEMRWLKNEVFYGSITPKALELFKC